MKVIAKTTETVLVEMTPTEFRHCFDPETRSTGEEYRGMDNIKIGQAVSVLGLSKHLIELRRQQPDLKQVRGVMQAFLALTEPEAITKTLEAAGIPIPLEADSKQQDEPG